MSLPLKSRRALSKPISMGDVENPQLDQVARSQFAVDGKIEQGKVASRMAKLKANADRPDVTQPEGCFLTDESAFVPGLLTHGRLDGRFHDVLAE